MLLSLHHVPSCFTSTRSLGDLRSAAPPASVDLSDDEHHAERQEDGADRVLEQRDQKSWRQVTHTIKGAARGVGAFGMGQAAADAEPVDPAAYPDQAGQALEKLKSKGEAVQAFIADYLAA